MRLLARSALAATFVLMACSSSRQSGPMPLPTSPAPISVKGVARTVNLSSLDDPRIGLGLSQRLVQQLQESGHFLLLDENQAVTSQRRNALMLAWATASDPVFDTLPVDPAAKYEASATIRFFGRPSQSVSAGFIHYERNSAVMRIEVCLKALPKGESYCAVGEGQSQTDALSAVFQFEGERLLYEKSDAGRAGDEALRQALAQLLPP